MSLDLTESTQGSVNEIWDKGEGATSSSLEVWQKETQCAIPLQRGAPSAMRNTVFLHTGGVGCLLPLKDHGLVNILFGWSDLRFVIYDL